ncbi:MAG: hypothetical protein JW955_01795 [Sedimentisphaerales bacterium]|nr:hypothetical protein [Sedimentisphaerales bacterium]
MTVRWVDSGQATIGDLLVVGMRLERSAQRFYAGLAEMFRHVPEVADFWQRFAADETLHEKRLSDLHTSTAEARLLEPGPAHTKFLFR